MTTTDSRAFTPFWRDAPQEGWYFVDDRRVLSGPYAEIEDCYQFITEAKQEFPRS